MSSDRPLEREREHRELLRRTLGFSILGLLGCVVIVAGFETLAGEAAHRANVQLLQAAEFAGRPFASVHAPSLIVVGVVAGLLAGMLGMGGGVLKVAGMVAVFQVDILLARTVSLTTMFIATAVAARVHARSGAVRWELVRVMVGPAIVGVLAGTFIGYVVDPADLRHFFAFLVIFLGFNMVAQTATNPDDRWLSGDDRRPPSATGAAAVGGVHGLVCGLLGISGGVIATPAQQLIARVPARSAVANTIFVSAISTAIGASVSVAIGCFSGSFQLGDVAFATLCVGGGATVGAQIGARLTGKIPVFVLKILFVIASFAAGLAILMK